MAPIAAAASSVVPAGWPDDQALAATACFHCGEPLPASGRFQALVLGEQRPMCCAGCAAVAQAIVDGGLESYYRTRESRAAGPRAPRPAALPELRIFDREEIQRAFVDGAGADEREASLILEGISCPACIWLNEAHLARQPGVTAVQINYTTRRARVRWNPALTRLSDILAAVQAIGYRAYPYDHGAMEASRERERRDALLRLAVAGLGMMQVMMYAFPAYVAGAGDMTADASALMRWASLVLTFPVVAYSALPFFRGAVRDLRRRRAGMDVPVALGVGAAFAVSVMSTVLGRGEVYFDSVAMFVFFLLGGRYLELRARHQAAEHLEFLARSTPAVAHRFLDFASSEQTETLPAGALHVGDRVLVRPGENFPADGRIERGSTQVDEGLLTGESRPLARHAGDVVVGGSINCGHVVTVEIRHVGDQTVLSSIVRLMERAAQGRPRIQELTDRVALRFVGFVLAVALAAGLYWTWADPSKAMPVVLAVLVVTCPCALSLATPMVMAVATASFSRFGLIVTRAGAIETLARATHFVFDKTGTLTEGKLRVAEIRVYGSVDRARALQLAAALERQSEHPLGAAIVAAGPGDLPRVEQVVNHPGEGIEGTIDGRRLRVGRKSFVEVLCGAVGDDRPHREEATQVWLGDARGMLAQFFLEDRLRPEARKLVEDLLRSGMTPALYSGDGLSAVRGVASSLGIHDYQARMLPSDKEAAVRKLQGEEGAVVAMVGDGVNDAPVLAQAQVSIAMGGGAALAQGAADMVLVSPRIDEIARGVQLARKAMRIVRQNLFWAFAYNVVALPLAVGGWLTPWVAGIGMSASSLLVVLNALRATPDSRETTRASSGALNIIGEPAAPVVPRS